MPWAAINALMRHTAADLTGVRGAGEGDRVGARGDPGADGGAAELKLPLLAEFGVGPNWEQAQ